MRTWSCPRCSAERFASAPIVLVSPVVQWTLNRRRYRCAGCGQVGWHRRLARRDNVEPSLSPGVASSARAIRVLIFVTALLVGVVFLVRECGGAASASQSAD